MSIVVDASVALKWFLPEPDSAKAEELLGSHDILVAPTLIVSEVCNAVWKRLRRGETTAQHADRVPTASAPSA
jgi:predicted nucleic acid-binding protein